MDLMINSGVVIAFISVWMLVLTLNSILFLLFPNKQDNKKFAVSVFYHQAFVEAFTGDLDLVAGVTRMMLLIGDHAEDADDNFVDDIDADEAVDGSYGRVTITTPAMNDDDANDRAEWDFDDIVYTALDNDTITEAAAYLQVGGDDTTPGDDILIALWDIADTLADGSDFTLQVGTEGAVQFA